MPSVLRHHLRAPQRHPSHSQYRVLPIVRDLAAITPISPKTTSPTTSLISERISNTSTRLLSRQTTDIFDGLELTLSDGTRLVLGSTIYQQHGIIGRGTCVVRARRVEKTKNSGTDDDAWDGPLIVKLSWPAKSKISENDII